MHTKQEKTAGKPHLNQSEPKAAEGHAVEKADTQSVKDGELEINRDTKRGGERADTNYVIEWMGLNFDVFPGFQQIP